MKKQVADIDTVTVEVKFKDGTVIRSETPATLLLSYQNFDIKATQDNLAKTGKPGLPDTDEDVGGIQILGTAENIKFALFSLLRQLVDTIGAHDVIETFNRIMVYVGDQAIADRKLQEMANDPDRKAN